MGMDALDIQFRIEKTFQISLTVEEMRSLLREDDLRVGDLYDYLLKKLTLRDRARYDLHLNYELWRDVQRKLQSITGQTVEEITLTTRLEHLFPRSTIRIAWASLQESTPHRLPQLEFSENVRRTVGMLPLGLTISLMAIGLWGLVQLGVSFLWFILGLLMMPILLEFIGIFEIVFVRWRSELPASLTTVKDLCRVVLADNYVQICRQSEVSIDERCLDAWHKLQDILQGALQVERSEITFQSGLIRDLGMS